MNDDTSMLSITAHIDLLGFSSHLIASSNDLRTKIGNVALKRLEILEEALQILRDEQKKAKRFSK